MSSVAEEGSWIFAIEEQSSVAEKADSLNAAASPPSVVRVVVRRRPLFYFLSGTAETPFAPSLHLPLFASLPLLFSHLPPHRILPNTAAE